MRKIIPLILILFFTLCSNAQLALESFETSWTGSPAHPVNWTVINEQGPNITWVQSITGNQAQPPHSGTHAAYLAREQVTLGDPIPKDWLITPYFNVPTNAQLHFFSRLTFPQDQGGIYKVKISTNPDPSNLASYTDLETWTEMVLNPSQTEYIEKIVTLPTITGSAHIAFVMEGNNKDRWLIDDVRVISQCFKPTGLTANNIQTSTADFSWIPQGTESQWEVQIVLNSDFVTGIPDATVSSPNYSPPLGTLQEDTSYKLFVRAVCDASNKSPWELFSFVTAAYGERCDTPIVITSLPYSTTNNTQNFANNYNTTSQNNCSGISGNYLSGFDVVYSYTATTNTTLKIYRENAITSSGVYVYQSCNDIGINCIAGGALIPQLNVITGQTYYFVVSSSSYLYDTTAYNLVVQESKCESPVALETTNLQANSVDLSWTNPTNATSWQIVVQTLNDGFPTGNGTTVTQNTNSTINQTFSGGPLLPATKYEYYVRSACENGGFSGWAGPYVFNTVVCNSQNQCPYTFILTCTPNTWGWNGNRMAVKQNGITVALLGETFEGIEGPVEVNVSLCPNIPFQLFWNEGGYIQEGINVSIRNPFNQKIYTKGYGAGVENSLLYESMVNCTSPVCVAPTDLKITNPTTTSVSLSWEGTATGEWEYYYVTTGGAPPTSTSVGQSTTTNPVTINNLNPATIYDFYVRYKCSNTEKSNWSIPVIAATESCLPEDKCIYTAKMTSNNAFDWYGTRMTVSQNGIVVAEIGSTFTDGNGSTEVEIPLCKNIPFQLHWTEAGYFPNKVGITIENSFNQPIYTKEIGTGTPNSLLYESTVNCDTPACIAPTGLMVTNRTATSVDFSWDGPVNGEWEYYYVEDNGTAPTATTQGQTANTKSVTISPLDSETSYDLYVRYHCENGQFTNWSGPKRSPRTCTPENMCVYTFEMTRQTYGYNWNDNTMTVLQNGIPIITLGPNFNPGASTTIQVPLCPDADIEILWNDKTEMTEAPQKIGLKVYSPFDEIIYALAPTIEDGVGTTIYSSRVSCTPPSCPKPQNLMAQDIQLNGATITWTEMGNANEWEIWVLPYGSPEPTTPGITVEVNSYNAPLQPGRAYVVYVRSNCDDNETSILSKPFNFVTPIQNDICTDALVLQPDTSVTCNPVNGTLTGATSTGTTPSCYFYPPTHDVWYKFVATATTHIVNVKGIATNAFYAVYQEGEDCSNLTEIACSLGAHHNDIIRELTIGNTYFIQVYSNPIPFNAITSFDICILTPAPIITDNTTYTVPQLVNNILMPATCGQVSNIIWKTRDTENGIAMFSKANSSFPLKQGMVLSTGNGMDTAGPNYSFADDVAERQFFLANGYTFCENLGLYTDHIDPAENTYTDVTTVEFDFIPATTHFSLPFIFASSEYGLFQCHVSDAFSCFLTGPDNIPVNIAIVPGTTDPISVFTIRNNKSTSVDSYYECNFCNEKNTEYFGNAYSDTEDKNAPVNFTGTTVLMTAQSDVIIGQTYHIKLVISEGHDSFMDSAVFIGEFNMGNTIDLGLDLTVENKTALCTDETITLKSGIDPTKFGIIWLRNNDIIAGQTGPDLIVTQPGEYTVNVQYLTSTCTGTDSIKIEFYPSVEENTGTPIDLKSCDINGFAMFDLSVNTDIIAQNGTFEISYHTTEIKARLNEEPLNLSYTNVIPFEQTIYARIFNTKTLCLAVKEFKLIVGSKAPKFKLTNDTTVCEGTPVVLSVTEGDFDPSSVSFAWTLNNEILTAQTLSSLTVTETGLYSVTVSQDNCATTQYVTVTVLPTPIAQEISDVSECNSYILPILDLNSNYYTGSNATGEKLNAGTKISTTQVIYILASNEICQSESSFNVTIVPTASFIIAQKCDGNNYVLEIIFNEEQAYNIDNTNIKWYDEAETLLGNDKDLILINTGTYKAIITPLGETNCETIAEVTVDNTTCEIQRGISPNGDGKNDMFDLSRLNVSKLTVLNRYGKEVYTKSNYTKEWHGQTNKGDELPTGTYFYVIEHKNGKSFTGWIYINRQDN